MKSFSRQQGGTLLGFLLGLLVGLGISLAVAVYVTKVPVPLMDKGVQRKPDQEAIEAERNKAWNPNAALAPKPAASPPPATATPGTTAPATVAKPAAQPAGSAAAPSVTKSSTDPLGELIQSRTKGPGQVAPVEVSTADPFMYFVQVGAFRTTGDAETQRARLAMIGLDAKITEREQGGKTVYRVRLGPYEQKTQADATQQRLNAQGVESALVRVQR